MNYYRIYNEIIDNAILRDPISGYTEKHHILPKSLGGADHSHNLVKLTAREHFLCHWLLWKMYRNKQMAHAFNMMCINNKSKRQHQRHYNSKGYAAAKLAMQIMSKGSKRPRTKEWQDNINKALRARRAAGPYASATTERKNKVRAALLGKPKSEETKRKLREAWVRRKERMKQV